MADKKIIALTGATGAQRSGRSRAIPVRTQHGRSLTTTLAEVTFNSSGPCRLRHWSGAWRKERRHPHAFWRRFAPCT